MKTGWYRLQEHVTQFQRRFLVTVERAYFATELDFEASYCASVCVCVACLCQLEATVKLRNSIHFWIKRSKCAIQCGHTIIDSSHSCYFCQNKKNVRAFAVLLACHVSCSNETQTDSLRKGYRVTETEKIILHSPPNPFRLTSIYRSSTHFDILWPLPQSYYAPLQNLNSCSLEFIIFSP